MERLQKMSLNEIDFTKPIQVNDGPDFITGRETWLDIDYIGVNPVTNKHIGYFKVSRIYVELDRYEVRNKPPVYTTKLAVYYDGSCGTYFSNTPEMIGSVEVTVIGNDIFAKVVYPNAKD